LNLRPPARSKSSNVEWLGEIPEHWHTKPLKHLTRFINGFAFKPDEWSDDGIPIIRIENLNGGESFNSSNAVLPERYHVKKGDLLFGWSGNRGTSFGPFLWPSEGLHYLNQHIFRLAGFSCDKSWFYWCLVAVTKVIEEEAHGIIGMVHVTKGRLGAIKIPFIDRAEQKTIAKYLDYKSGQIDTLIRKKEELIGKLQEKRSALISQTVLRGLPPDAAKGAGLNPHPKMKDSGIEWLGEIPEHWEVMPYKRLCTRVDVGIAEAATHAYCDDGVPIIRSTNVKPNKLDTQNIPRVEPWFADKNRSKTLRAGDLITVRTGYPGTTAVVPDRFAGSQCFTLVLSSPKPRENSFFLSYMLNLESGNELFRYGGLGYGSNKY
jgi:type I restriction enzyme S subunit